MRILVTGADGFVASHLIPKLLDFKHELFLIGGDIHRLNMLYDIDKTNISSNDVSNNEFEQKIAEFLPAVVINLAAYSTSSDSYEDMERLFKANILFLGKLLNALKHSNLKCFIYTGSSTEFNSRDGIIGPAYLYSATKAAGRSILNYYSSVYNFKSVYITPYTVYGTITAQRKIIDILFDSLGSDKPVKVSPGEQVLDFIHVSDLTDLYCKAVNNLTLIPDGTNFHAGTGQGYTIRQLAALLEKKSGKKVNVIWGGIPYRENDTMHSVADIKMQEEVLNWHPSIELYKGINLYLESRGRDSVN